MNEQIKQRITQLNNGEVPNGYENTDFGIFPCDWVTDKKLKDLGSFGKGKGLLGDKMTTEGVPCVGYGDIYMKYNHFHFEEAQTFVDEGTASESQPIHKGTLLFTGTGETADEIGKCVCYNGNETIYAGGDIITFVGDKVNPLFLAYQQYQEFSLRKKASFGQGHSVVHIQRENLEKLNVAYPKSTEEQSKIAEILMKWDEAIQLNEQLVEQLAKRKNAITYNLLTSAFRLPGFSEEWKEREISTYLEVRDTQQVPTEEAPLMAFVAGVGIVDKGERYDRSFLVKDDAKKYKRTEMDDFIYSSNNLDVGSIGLNKYGTAVISVVYEIFKVKSNAVPLVISEIIQLPYNLNKILSFRQGALYGQYKIHAENFLSVKIKVPSYEEQKKIAKLICMLDEELRAKQEYLEKIKQQRKALQQYLLNGIVRV